jgi:hypothetical protein
VSKELIYECPFTDKPVKVDGILDDDAWKIATDLKLVTPIENKEPLSKTEAKVCWDQDHLYVGFKAYDKDIWSYYKEKDSMTCNEDVLEVFFKPDLNAEPYYNFEINALNAVYDAYNFKKGAGGSSGHRWAAWDCKNLKSAITIKGTLNNWEDVDEYWILEMAIPFADLPSLKGKRPQPGDVWLLHVARYDYSVYLPNGLELSSSAHFTQCDFHHWQDWPKLKFVK